VRSYTTKYAVHTENLPNFTKDVDTTRKVVAKSGELWGIVVIKEESRLPMVKALTRTVFVGTFRHAVDEKNRLAIPAKWRAAAKGSQEFFILPLPNNHLVALPQEAMDKMIQRVDEISIGEYERRNVLRLISGGAHGTPCDKQGRIALTDALLEHAGIKDEAVLVGVLKGFEIWSPERLEQVKRETSTNFAEAAKQLGL
jgi:MraZ protein